MRYRHTCGGWLVHRSTLCTNMAPFVIRAFTASSAFHNIAFAVLRSTAFRNFGLSPWQIKKEVLQEYYPRDRYLEQQEAKKVDTKKTG